jgi:cation transport ATPase
VNGSPTKVEFQVSGMTCAACVRRVERAALKVDGVVDASVNLATERAAIQLLHDNPAQLEAVRLAIQQAGYEAAWIPPQDPNVAAPRGAVDFERAGDREANNCAVISFGPCFLRSPSLQFP